MSFSIKHSIQLMLLLGLSQWGFCADNKYEIVSPVSPATEEEAALCINDLKQLNSKKDKSATEILETYSKERCVSSIVSGGSFNIESRRSELPPTSIDYRCYSYVVGHKNRFKEVPDGWKGEDNFWKPNRYWLKVLITKFPDSPERWKIEWEQDYEDLLAKFKYVDGARNKTCSEFYDWVMKQNPNDYAKSYPEEQVEKIKEDCESERLRYKEAIKNLLNKYKDRTGVPKLFDIDETNIISKIYFGLC